MKRQLSYALTAVAVWSFGTVTAAAQQNTAPDEEQPRGEQLLGERPKVQQSSEVVVMERADHRATELIGRPVIDSEGMEVGEIDDLVVSVENGDISAVLAIGGIAGIGERLISVPLDELRIPKASGQQETGEDAQNPVALAMTGEQLVETRPEFRYQRQESPADL